MQGPAPARGCMLGAWAFHPGRPRNSTGRRAFTGDVDSPQQFKLLPWRDPPGPVVVSCGTPGGCVFRDSPSGSRARGDEDEKGYGGVLGTGTRARLHGAAALRDPEYLDKLWVGSQAKRLRVRVQQTQGCVAAVPFFFPHIAARPLRRVPWGGEGSRKTARKTRRLRLS